MAKLQNSICENNRKYRDLTRDYDYSINADISIRRGIKYQLDSLSEKIHMDSERLLSLKYREQELMKYT